MESKNGFPNQIFQQTPDSLKDLMMEQFSAVDPKVNSEEKSSIFTHHGSFRSILSRNSFKLSTIKDVKVQMQERAKNVKASRVITFIVILIIIGLFSIPVILYCALKTDPNHPMQGNTSMTTLFDCPNMSIVNSTCTDDVIHTYESLKGASNYTNQFCLNHTYLFCEALEHCSSGQDNNASELLCTQVRQNICTAEWRIIEVNNRSEELIDCQGETSQPNCAEQFDIAGNNSVCLPLCKEFSQYGPSFTNFIVGLTVIVHLVNSVGGIIVIIACILNRAKMFKFPQIMTLLNSCMLTSTSFISLLSNITMGSWNPICSHRFLKGHLSVVGALDEPSAFCQIQSMVAIAGFVMYSVYWLLYAFHLYMKIAHPEYSTLLDNWNRTKKFYYFEVGFFTIIGTVPYIILAGLSEFNISQFPPLVCGYNSDGNFYGIVLPTLIVNCSTVIILLLVLHHVHIHMGIFKKSKKSWLCQITAPEVKISLIFCYQLVFFVVLWTSISQGISKYDMLAITVQTYFWCSINGVHDQLDCEQHRRELNELSVRWSHVLFLLLGAFLNLSNLPLIIEYKKVKHMILSTLGRDTMKETEMASHVGDQQKISSFTP